MNRKPPYIPIAVWDAAIAEREIWQGHTESEYLEKLLADPALEATWVRLGRQLYCQTQWRQFLDLLITTPTRLDAEQRKKGLQDPLRGALKEADELLGAIEKEAAALSRKLARYEQVCERHGIDYPRELSRLDALVSRIERVRRGTGEFCWRWYKRCLYGTNRASAFKRVGRFGSELALIVGEISDAAAGHECTANDPDVERTLNGYGTLIADAVRDVYARLEIWYRADPGYPSIDLLPANFDLSSADLARLLSALLCDEVGGEEITRQRVDRIRHG